ncbi:hypothetical protein KAI78_04380 [bacterium]|nr:hypothetical protein [bacterium]
MNKRAYKLILISVYSILAVLSLIAFIKGNPVWAVDSLFWGLVLFVLFLMKKTLNMTPFVFILLSGIVVMHSAAVFGLYGRTIFGLEYDTYIHVYASITLAILCFQYLRKFRIPLLENALFAVLLTLGIGLLNELIEFAGYRLFGEGEGFFLLGPGDIGSTNPYENLMTDFFSNFWGNLIGIAAALVYYTVRKTDKK